MQKPETSEYAPFYSTYVDLITEPGIVAVLESQPTELQDMFTGRTESDGEFAYAEGKWSIKEVLSHIIDAERIFAYRVLRISRGDTTPLEGFEQNSYIEFAYANERSFGDLLAEFRMIRRANLLMFNHLRDDGWLRTGTASGSAVSVRALAYIMAGHFRHHAGIIRERYLNAL